MVKRMLSNRLSPETIVNSRRESAERPAHPASGPWLPAPLGAIIVRLPPPLAMSLLFDAKRSTCAFLATCLVALPAVAQMSTTRGQWPSYTGDTRGSRYSPLD